MTTGNVPRRSVAADLSDILSSPEVSRLIDELQETRLTGRPGYPLRSMVGMALAKSLYALPMWTRTVALVREHPASRWIKADRLHPLIPRETLRWKGLYRGRASVERAFGRAKNEMGARAAPSAQDRACAAPCRPHDPFSVDECAESGTGCSAGGVGASI
jgi:hypothetical protein